MRRLIIILLIISSAFSAEVVKNQIHKLNWRGIEVVWLEDNRFPTYDFLVYFADGALSDDKRYQGETSAMFSLLGAGTRRFSQKEISDHLEYYGVSFGFNVTHEYALYSVSGLIKNLAPTMKLICHMFKDAVYPDKELDKEKRRMINDLNNLVAAPSGLAERAFRELSLRGTPFSFPVEGKISDIKRFTSKRLLAKKNYFNDRVIKKIYITGPAEVLKLQSIINEECSWFASAEQRDRDVDFKSPRITSALYFIPVPKINQAQIRLGRYLPIGDCQRDEALDLVSEFLGGGFTSQLVQEVRVKRGLTYSISAFAGRQKKYGRAGISTFTKNDSVVTTLDVINDTLERLRRGEFGPQDFLRAQGSLAGSYPFRFERSDAYLNQLLYMDHIEKDYQEIYRFPERINALTKDEITAEIGNIFAWEKQTVVIVGEPSLQSQLKKRYGKLKVISYKDFL